jgi:hypothetical protein
LKIATELKALQFITPTPSLSVEEIQSRVVAVLARLEVRESDLLLEQNDAISSSLCELSRRAFLQTLHHFECGLALPDEGTEQTKRLEDSELLEKVGWVDGCAVTSAHSSSPELSVSLRIKP